MAKVAELEGAVMDVLWSAEAALTVRTVQERLGPTRTLAYTTVMTVMERLFRKGLVTRESAGKAYQYLPAASHAAYTASLMEEALSSSDDRGAALVNFTERLSGSDLAALKRVMAARSKPGRPKGKA
ncbi:MAG: transcriptional repressor, CopY family [Frankiales bacterium]|nr:transcriptional repressor, CopY family [Frankiales bacterium]